MKVVITGATGHVGRYAVDTLSRAGHHVVRIDLPCSPCGQVRLPPERCRGHVPDCLDGIGVDRVVREALAVLDSARERA